MEVREKKSEKGRTLVGGLVQRLGLSGPLGSDGFVSLEGLEGGKTVESSSSEREDDAADVGGGGEEDGGERVRERKS